MPLKSKAENRFLWATNPKVAREMADKTPSIKKLPERVHPAVKEGVKSFLFAHGVTKGKRK